MPPKESPAWYPEKPTVAICIAQTLFLQGGAELLVHALERELRLRDYRVEMVRLPFTWRKTDLLPNALLWRLATVEADRVIATNFPSYFVKHPNKVVWLLHQHRKLYDLYGTPFSDFGQDPMDDEVRRIVTAADTRFLSEAQGLFTISRTVSERLQRFNGLSSEPLYHPPPLHRSLSCREYGDFVLMPTRLEDHKRPELFVEAMKHTRSGVTAVIAGRGPLERELRRQVEAAGLGRRVNLAGFVDEGTLLELYGSCAMVFYAPFDEDYGYASLEAFHAKKPVITTVDAGGVLEFVEHEATGLVAEADPAAVAAQIDRLATERDLARRLGEAGYERVRRISWDAVIPRLLGEAAPAQRVA